MFDIGIGELLALAVIGLLIFGPERLPKAAADAGRWVRQIREMATSARKEIVDSAGVDFSDTMNTFKDFRDLHPKRLASGLLDIPSCMPARPRGRLPSVEAMSRSAMLAGASG
jgi:Tat protein translocase TatB subunit